MTRTLPSLLLLIMLSVSACAGPKITAEDVVIARYQSESQQACYRAQAAQAQQYPDARDAALVIMAQALAGRGSNPCGVTNVYDARAAIATAQNQAAGAVIGNVATATMATAGIIAGADVLKTAVNNAGAKTTTNITGDHNSATHTSYDTRAHTDNNVSAGDNSPVSVRNPPVTGPDLSTTTVHEAPAASEGAP